jgi:protein-tyrosine phosphatase
MMCQEPTSSNQEEFADSATWITPRIAVGMFLSPERAPQLRERGIGHVLNVGENPSIVHKGDFGFAEIVDCPIVDLARIPNDVAIFCIDTMLAMLRSSPDSKVYVHCLAGQNRSPTVVWLFLVACGVDPAAAKHWIKGRVRNSVPGHRDLVDERLIRHVIAHGRLHDLTPADAGIVDADG